MNLTDLPTEILVEIVRKVTTMHSPAVSNRLSNGNASVELSRYIQSAQRQLLFIQLTCKRLLEIGLQARKTFIHDFMLCIQLQFKSLQYKTRHPTHAQSSASAHTALSFDIQRCFLKTDVNHFNNNFNHSGAAYIRFIPLNDSSSVEFSESLDSLRELSLSITNDPYSNDSAQTITSNLESSVYRLDLNDYEGIHYSMEVDCVLCYYLTKVSTVSYKSIIKNGDMVQIPVSAIKQVININWLLIHDRYFSVQMRHIRDSLEDLVNARLQKLQKLVQERFSTSLVINYRHEFILHYLHDSNNSSNNDKSVNELLDIIHSFNGIVDRRTIMWSVIQSSNNGYSKACNDIIPNDHVLFEVPEFKRFILQSTPYSDQNSTFLTTKGRERYLINDRYKYYIRWNGITSLLTDEMANTERYISMAETVLEQHL